MYKQRETLDTRSLPRLYTHLREHNERPRLRGFFFPLSSLSFPSNYTDINGEQVPASILAVGGEPKEEEKEEEGRRRVCIDSSML